MVPLPSQDQTSDGPLIAAPLRKGNWAPAIVSAGLAWVATQLGAWTGLDSLIVGGVSVVVTLLLIRVLTRPRDHGQVAANGPAAPLVSEVLPVWKRQIDKARHHSEESIGGILTSFRAISERLDQAYAKVDALSAAMIDLRQIAVQIEQLARRTSMAVPDASVEASPADDRVNGFVAAAQEVRQLATQSGEAANQMISLTHGIDLQLQAWRAQAAAHNGGDEALRERADGSARAVVGSLLQSLGDLDTSSKALQEAGGVVHEEFERVLMNFQSQDRLSQMLCCVMDDMSRLTDWLEQGGDVSASQAGEWLARLDASYTMEEQRSEHHGNASIQRETAVEFF